MLRRFIQFATVLLVTTSSFAQSPFTLEQILSSPFPSGLIAAPTDGKLAWVQNAEGRRNIWVATSPEYKGQQLTRYNTDDGQEITKLQFNPSSTEILFVRGGGPNAAGELPNPRSEPTGVKRSIWIVKATGGNPQELSEGSGAEFDPYGKSIAFIHDGQIWTVSANGKTNPSQLSETRGRISSLRWSPDGTKLAFVSHRGDHSFVGVYEFAEKRLRYLDPGLANDGEPVWSPDSKYVAFLRIPHERQRLPFGPRREAVPWSIRIADSATGKGELIFTAKTGVGSAFHSITAANQLIWTVDDRLVFPWEREGFVHLYSVPTGGGTPTLLTPGNHEVEHVYLAPKGEEILYSSNQDDIDRRHIFRVDVSGGTPHAVTSGDGIEWSPVMTSDSKAIAYLSSTAKEPAHARVHLGPNQDRKLAASSMPSNFPTSLVKPEQLILSGADGATFHAQLFKPAPRTDGTKHPAAIFFHGGSRRQMLLGWHYMGYYHNAYAFNQYLASRGYVVLSVNYRSGTGYGMKFREALSYGATGASEFQDVLGAGLYLRSRADVDPNRIALWGGSYGGYLTALGLSRAPDLFAAGVDIHGVHDWNIVIRNFVPTYDAEKHATFARLAFESSPMAFVDDWRAPVLLIHGDDDRNVPFSESVDLAEALAKRGVLYEELVFPDEVHGFLLHENWLRTFHAAADFLARQN